jgi:peptidyl-prolyl cis-trans isomerase SurA
MVFMKRLPLLAFLLFQLVTVAQSQPRKVVADKIITIVGDRIILLSDIQNSLADIARQGGTIPENGECLLMEQAVISKILMLQAQKDSLPVTDEEVEAELDQKIRYKPVRQPGRSRRNGRQNHLPDQG